ncbi:MAG TPA: Crp/Fnr family transcriptional regulator [Stenomitos sp.]
MNDVSPSLRSDLVKFLSQTMLFQNLPVEHLNDLAALAIAQPYAKNEVLFHQGDPARGFFIVQSGRIKVFKLSAEGKEQILHIFGRNDHFAEVPALDGESFPASAAALEQTEVLFFPRLAFLQLLEAQPKLAINLLKSFARHLRLFSHLIDDLVFREVPGRLAAYLLGLSPLPEAGAETVALDLTKGQLAARLGTIPETLSRVFAKLSRDGLIEVDGGRVRLLDMPSLQRLAGNQEKT